MKKAVFLWIALLTAIVSAQVEDHHHQILLVLSDHWNTHLAKMWVFEREDLWTQVEGPIEVTLGRNGLAWGKGIHGVPPQNGPQRKEWDYRSPAGIYSIDSIFGFKPVAHSDPFDLPYTCLLGSMECVTDANSKHFNKIVDTDFIKRDWTDSVNLSSDIVFEYGAVLGFNTKEPIDPKAGSGLFIHLWRAPGEPTAGCTGMAKKDIVRVLQRLRKEKRPLIVQLTYEDYRNYQELWKLPILKHGI